MEEFKGDKRTKAYKEWKAKFEKENAKKSKDNKSNRYKGCC